MSAGGLQNLANAYVTLYMLKAVHQSTLPVEIFFNGADEFDVQSQQFFQVSLAAVEVEMFCSWLCVYWTGLLLTGQS